MDFISCKKKNLIKPVGVDKNLVNSLIKSSSKKFNAQSLLILNDDTASSKITLIYDAMREILEALAISKGYKIYNHECYSAFLKEVMKESYLGDTFNNFRKIRNDIDYYGKDISANESKPVIDGMVDYIKIIKTKFFKK